MSGSRLNRKVLVASLAGSAIEWFDYFLYGTMASLVFSKLFFPAHDPVVALMLSYLSFSLSFFIRPIGGVIFSHIGDRVGRKKTLVLTLSLMGGATAGIGLLPTYQQVGLLAPCLLILLRLIQGIGIGGEWGGALLLAYEYAPPAKRGLFGSIPQTGVTVGMLLSTISVSLISLLPEQAMMSWGWRAPFILSAGLVGLGLWIRKGIDETPEFKAAQASPKKKVKYPLIETARRYPREILIAVGAKFVETGPFYIFTTFVVSYATSTLGAQRLSVLNAVTIAALVSTFTIPLAGALSDRVGRKRLYLIGCVLMALFAGPYFLLLSVGTPVAITIATVLGVAAVWPLVTAVLGTLMSEIFSTEVRYTGITLGYQIGAAVAGGTAPLLATWLLSVSGNNWRPIAGYIVLTALISIVAVSRARTGGRDAGVAPLPTAELTPERT